MQNIRDFLNVEHDSEHDLKIVKRQYSHPEIYHGGDSYDLSKRWYIYYSYRNPYTGRMVRQPNIYIPNQKQKGFKERFRELKMIQRNMLILLKKGFSPYLHPETKEKYTVKSALEWAMELKRKTLTENTGNDYAQKLSQFLKYLDREGLDYIPIDEFKRKPILEYLNEVLQKNTAKTRNNHRIVLSSLFSVLKANDYILENPVEGIGVEKTKSVRHKTYSTNQLDKLWKALEKEPELHLFVKFVAYNFLRPIEVCRLRYEDLKLEEKQPYLEVKAKNKALKTKIIPKILLNEINEMKGTGLIFLTNDKGINTTENNRRDYFTKKFLEVKKQLNLGEEYTMYSFRHTYITKLYRELIKTRSKLDTESTLMLITGHSTLKALQSYLRDLDALIPEDYSDMLT